MRFTTRTLRITGALAIAISLVGGSYVLSGPSFLGAKTVGAEGTEELLRAYAAKDTDGDLLPDWQEALYGTDPNKVISTIHGIPDGEAVSKGLLTPQSLAAELPEEEQNPSVTEADLPGVDPAPGSITDEFSKEFLRRYVAASNGEILTEESQQALLDALLVDFSARAAKILESSYTQISIRTDSTTTILEYSQSVETILRANDVPVESSNPVMLMEALIQKNDNAARSKLVAISDTYRALAKNLLLVPAPPSLAKEHLALVRSFDSLARSTKIITEFEKDPLGVLGALSVFQNASLDLAQTFTSIGTTIVIQGEPSNNTPGSLLVFLGRIPQKP